jgi:hypothetical protein
MYWQSRLTSILVILALAAAAPLLDLYEPTFSFSNPGADFFPCSPSCIPQFSANIIPLDYVTNTSVIAIKKKKAVFRYDLNSLRDVDWWSSNDFDEFDVCVVSKTDSSILCLDESITNPEKSDLYFFRSGLFAEDPIVLSIHTQKTSNSLFALGVAAMDKPGFYFCKISYS